MVGRLNALVLDAFGTATGLFRFGGSGCGLSITFEALERIEVFTLSLVEEVGDSA
jgi:hypothetical protein